MISAGKRWLFGLGSALIILIADQASKAWALAATENGPRRVTSFFDLVLVWNRGVSFGLFNNHNEPLPPVLFIVISLVIAGIFLIWLRKAETRLLALSLGLVIGGAIGNVIDRVRFGGVVDFLDFHWGDRHWPAFNVADSAIVIGIAMLLFDSLFLGTKSASPKIHTDAHGEKHAD